jgi:hypothetical protein
VAFLAEGQYELDGLVMGHGTPYRVLEITFRGLPEIRVHDEDRALRDGVLIGPDLMGGRNVTARIQVDGQTPAEALELLDQLTARLAPGATRALRLRPTGYPAPRRVDIVARSVGEEPLAGRRSAVVPVTWLAPDPLLLSDTPFSMTVGLATVTGGLGFPHGFAHGFGSALPGLIAATNAGNAPVWPTARITAGPGGATNLSIEHTARGEALVWSDTLAAGDFLDIDFAGEQVLLNGLSSRFHRLTEHGFFQIHPGPNPITFTGSGNAHLELGWFSAWAL